MVLHKNGQNPEVDRTDLADARTPHPANDLGSEEVPAVAPYDESYVTQFTALVTAIDVQPRIMPRIAGAVIWLASASLAL